MADRNARVVLDLVVDRFISNARRASQATEQIGQAAERAGQQTDRATARATESVRNVATAHQAAAKSAGLHYNAAGQLVDANGKVQTSAQAAAHGLEAYSSEVHTVAQATAEAASEAEKYAEKQKKATEQVGGIMTAFGATTVAALGAATKAAMDWESAWAGVTKTTDGTPEQMAALESGLRGLARTLPSTHTEIAAVAEAAGQLGVKREDILSFTKTMIDLGETTNLTAEEAATDIAQIANVFQTSGDDIDNFGATLVALGNDGASTEKDILSMAQRIAGAGKLVGASEADVLALSNTLASMGVKAELGGGVATRALLKMYAAVQEGGPKLDAFAKAAGTSSESFAKAFRESPVAALEMVTKGMARTKDEGGNVVAIMKEMGLKGTEEMQVMLALAGAGDLLSDSLALGSKAWEENTALIVEATKRYETTESKVKVAWNNIKDAAIDAGAAMLPVVAGIAENISGLAQGFGQLPAPVQGALSAVAGVAGATALAGGGLMLLLPKVKDGIQAFKDLDTRADGSSRGLGKFGKAAGIAAAGFVGFEIIKSVHNSMQAADRTTEQWTQDLLKLGKQGDAMDGAFKDIGLKEFEGEFTSAGGALKKLIHQDFNSAVESFGATVLGVDNGMAKISRAFENSDKAIAGAASSGNLKAASEGFKAIAASAKDQGIEVEDVAKKFPNYLNALRELANQHKVNVDDAALLKWAMGEIPPEMQKVAGEAQNAAGGLVAIKDASGMTTVVTKEVADALEEVGLAADGSVVSMEKWTGVLFGMGMLHLSATDAAVAYEASIDAMTEAVAKNGKTMDITTEAGRNNVSAYNNVAKAAIASATATAEETLATEGSAVAQQQLQGNLEKSYWDLIAAAGQMGITGGAADELARKALGIPKETPIKSWVDDKASSVLDGIKGKADALDGKTVTVTTREVTERHTIAYEERVAASKGNEPEGGGLYGSDRRAAGGEILRRAGGGGISGPGTSTSDEVLIWASPGEHMLDAGDVNKMGGQQGVYKFRAALKAGAFDYLAAGGAVGSTVMVARREVAAAPQVTPSVNLEGLTVLVQNPWTGEQVRGVVTAVARQQADAAITQADGDTRFARPGR